MKSKTHYIVWQVRVRGDVIPALDPDLESEFSFLMIVDLDLDPVKSGIVTPLVKVVLYG